MERVGGRPLGALSPCSQRRSSHELVGQRSPGFLCDLWEKSQRLPPAAPGPRKAAVRTLGHKGVGLLPTAAGVQARF